MAWFGWWAGWLVWLIDFAQGEVLAVEICKFGRCLPSSSSSSFAGPSPQMRDGGSNDNHNNIEDDEGDRNQRGDEAERDVVEVSLVARTSPSAGGHGKGKQETSRSSLPSGKALKKKKG